MTPLYLTSRNTSSAGFFRGGVTIVQEIVDLVPLFPLARAWFGLFAKSIFYWSLVSSTSELALGGPDLGFSVPPRTLRLLLPDVFFSLLPDLVQGNVLEFADGVKERPVGENALSNGFDGHTLIEARILKVGFIKPSHIFSERLIRSLFHSV